MLNDPRPVPLEQKFHCNFQLIQSMSTLKKTGKFVLVTVGTTEFDQLIEVIDEEAFILAVKRFGFDRVLIQHGRGTYQPKFLNHRESIQHDFKVDVEIIRFHENLAEIISQCDLLIGHCGAGTILDAVSSATKMIVVVNDSLQGNHQMELARILQNRGICLVTIPTQLLQCLAEAYRDNLLKTVDTAAFPILDSERFACMLDSMFEFS